MADLDLLWPPEAPSGRSVTTESTYEGTTTSAHPPGTYAVLLVSMFAPVIAAVVGLLLSLSSLDGAGNGAGRGPEARSSGKSSAIKAAPLRASRAWTQGMGGGHYDVTPYLSMEVIDRYDLPVLHTTVKR